MSATRPAKTASFVPIRAELVQTARDLVPTLKERALATEELRCLPDETMADLKTAGIHRIFIPKRYGGYEMEWGTHVDVSRELAQGCGSTGWVSSVVLSHSFLFGRFAPEAQEEIWGENNDAIIPTGFAGGGGITPTEGGYILNGRWRFASGIDHGDAALVGARLPNSTAVFIDRWLALKKGEYEIVDTWYAEGLKGTGSKDILVKDQFVPAHRTLSVEDMSSSSPPGARFHDSYIYGADFHSFFVTLLAGPILGTARGCYNEYVELTRERVGAMMGETIVDQVPVQVHVAESLAEIETADMLVDNMCDLLHRKGLAGEMLVGAARLKIRRDLCMAAVLCKRASERLSGMMGVSGQTGQTAVQRHYRDCRTMTTHSAVHWDTMMSTSGKYIFGLKTGDMHVDTAGD